MWVHAVWRYYSGMFIYFFWDMQRRLHRQMAQWHTKRVYMICKFMGLLWPSCFVSLCSVVSRWLIEWHLHSSYQFSSQCSAFLLGSLHLEKTSLLVSELLLLFMFFKPWNSLDGLKKYLGVRIRRLEVMERSTPYMIISLHCKSKSWGSAILINLEQRDDIIFFLKSN